MDKLLQIEKKYLAKTKVDFPDFKQGDIIKVYYKIREKDKIRVHPLEGIVIKIQGQLHRKSFTLRRSAYGESYEVTFPFYSPNIDKIEMVKKAKRKPRRKRLYYLRSRIGRKAFAT